MNAKGLNELPLNGLIRYPVLSKLASLLGLCSICAAAYAQHDTSYYRNFKQPYSVKFSLEKTGAGLEFSPDNSINLPTASFPFNSGVNAAITVSYKILNFSISKSLSTSTRNGSLVFATRFYSGSNVFGGKIGLYNNIASVRDKRNLNVETTIRLFKFTPYWLMTLNNKRFSISAISDFSQQQKKSAGSFIFEISPMLSFANGNGGQMIPADAYYRSIFEDQAGLERANLVNIDFRPGYAYTKVFEEGKYFLNGGLLLGPGFGYHAVNALKDYRGFHWQSSLRMMASAGMHQDKYFLVAYFRYMNSFTPVHTLGMLSHEGTIGLTIGLKFGALEKKIPNNFNEIIRMK